MSTEGRFETGVFDLTETEERIHEIGQRSKKGEDKQRQ